MEKKKKAGDYSQLINVEWGTLDPFKYWKWDIHSEIRCQYTKIIEDSCKKEAAFSNFNTKHCNPLKKDYEGNSILPLPEIEFENSYNLSSNQIKYKLAKNITEIKSFINEILEEDYEDPPKYPITSPEGIEFYLKDNVYYGIHKGYPLFCNPIYIQPEDPNEEGVILFRFGKP